MGRCRIRQRKGYQYRGRKMPELLEPALVSLLVLKLVLELELVSVKGLSARINLE